MHSKLLLSVLLVVVPHMYATEDPVLDKTQNSTTPCSLLSLNKSSLFTMFVALTTLGLPVVEAKNGKIGIPQYQELCEEILKDVRFCYTNRLVEYVVPVTECLDISNHGFTRFPYESQDELEQDTAGIIACHNLMKLEENCKLRLDSIKEMERWLN